VSVDVCADRSVEPHRASNDTHLKLLDRARRHAPPDAALGGGSHGQLIACLARQREVGKLRDGDAA
jgi:hypothetical protein